MLVIPDNNGDKTSDSECSNSVVGNAETYLTKDVPNYMQSEFNAAIGKHAIAVAGLSACGTCSTILALHNPKTFSTFASFLATPRPPTRTTTPTDDCPALRSFKVQLRSPQPGHATYGQQVFGPSGVVHRTPNLLHRQSSLPHLRRTLGCRAACPLPQATTRSPSGRRHSSSRSHGCRGGWTRPLRQRMSRPTARHPFPEGSVCSCMRLARTAGIAATADHHGELH
jgi:hypothetical protein